MTAHAARAACAHLSAKNKAPGANPRVVCSAHSCPPQNTTVSVRVQVAAPPPASSLLDAHIIWPDAAFLFKRQGDGRDPISSGAYGAPPLCAPPSTSYPPLDSLPAPTSGGLCARQTLQYDSGYCFLVGSGLNCTCSVGGGVGWVLQEGGGAQDGRSAGRIVACGMLAAFNLTAWHNMSLAVSDGLTATMIVARVDGDVVVRQNEPQPVKWGQGMVSLRSGFHYALFDDLLVTA